MIEYFTVITLSGLVIVFLTVFIVATLKDDSGEYWGNPDR